MNDRMEMPEIDSRERFSLLLLDPGEIYFEDFAVFYYSATVSEDEAIQKVQKGRLKICSKSVVFDPRDTAHPILKFPLKDCTQIRRWTGPLLSRIDNQNMIAIESEQVVEMLADNVIAPFTFNRVKAQHLFALNYAKIEDCLPQMLQLSRASTLPAGDQAAMISAIVLSRQRMVKFDSCWIEDLHEQTIFETQGNRVTPLVTNPGRVLLTTSRLYFQSYNNSEPFPVFKIKLCDITRIVKRRFLLRHIGLEFYCSENAPVSRLFLSLKSPTERDLLYDNLVKQTAVKLQDTGQNNMMILWQNGVISNYDYLLYLNSMADRSFNDLTQYPVFPWVIADYSKHEFDLEDPSFFRDLSKPIGALNDDRLQKLKARYEEMPYPRFLYGSHYSTPGFVLYYLVRKVPLYMLCLHNGRFDQPDRMFNSIADTWKNVSTNTADFKELTPEFYQTDDGAGDFLVNTMNLSFGLRQDGTKVGDVELPKWAKDHRDCILKFRQALESDYVSSHLHDWIDLVFGYKQRGTEAERADNVFYYLTYEGAKDLDSVEDLNDRYSLEVQIMEFGQVPRQLFAVPHPKKLVDRLVGADHYFLSDAIGSDDAANVGEHGWMKMENLHVCCQQRLHKNPVSAVCLSSDGSSVFSVAHDSMLKMFSVTDKRQLRSVNLSNMSLSSCVLMPDEKTVIVGSWDNCVYMYSVEYGKILETTMAHDDAVSSIFWNNGLLATASWDSTAKLWSYSGHTGVKIQSCAQLLAELDHDTRVTCVSLNSDSSYLVSGTTDGRIYIWDTRTYLLIGKHEVHQGEVHGISVSPDDQRIVSCGDDLKVLDFKTGTKTFSKDTADELRCLCWNGQVAVTGSSSGSLYVWDLVSAQLVERVPGHDGEYAQFAATTTDPRTPVSALLSGPVTCIAVSKDNRTLVTGGEDGVIIVWKCSGDVP